MAEHIKRAHGGIGEPIENGNLDQHVNPSFPGGNQKPTQDMKPPNSYNRYNRTYINHVSKSSKGDEDFIDKVYKTVTEQQERERKMRTIKEFYCRYPDAPMPIPKVDSNNFPIKNMLEQSLPKIPCQNESNNNPSPQIQGHNNTNKIASQKTGANSPLVAFPGHNRDSDPQSFQPVPKNYDDKGDDYSGTVIKRDDYSGTVIKRDDYSGIVTVKKDDVDQWGFKVTWTIEYNSLGDILTASVTDGLYSYLTEQEKRRDKYLREHLSS
jgi:hypothetical protein